MGYFTVLRRRRSEECDGFNVQIRWRCGESRITTLGKQTYASLVGACFALLMVSSATAAELGDMPATGKTTEQIARAAEEVKGFGFVQSAEFNRLGHRIFALWFCPFSGRDSCFLRVYYYDWDKAEWRCFINELVDSHDLSPEIPSPISPVAAKIWGVESRGEMIVFRSAKGEIVFKASVAELPRQPR